MRRTLFFLLILSQSALAGSARQELRKHLQPAVFSVTMVMIHDVVNPPAASRFYTYCLMGAHEIVALNNKQIVAPGTFTKSINPVTVVAKDYDYQIAALYCILETGRLIIPSGYMLEEDQKKLIIALLREGYPQTVIDKSVAVAREVAGKVAADAATDGYLTLSTRLRYRPKKGDAYWYPTPPGYIEGVEPHWKTIRPMLIDSCDQFIPKPPVEFSKDSSSAFYKLVKEVYNVGQNLTEQQRFIASYWDCNPFAINTSGHMNIGFKKISPGGALDEHYRYRYCQGQPRSR
ncbi:hypothetical protein [Dyadobacter sp. 676]|uniref:Uncharacterized protein n=1 Tax=Dyadobacter sp. 676 TaxID=3088362 RepID=A0AAU8FQC6_9BACT